MSEPTLEARLPGAVVVTGGGSGIGRAAALACAARGAPVAVVDIDFAGARKAAGEAEAISASSAVGISCDARDEEAVSAAIGEATARLGPIRGLVACAGIDRGGLAHELAIDVWSDVIATNLTGTFLACKHVLGAMLAHGEGGSIVCTSSPVAELAVKGGASAYCASKGAVSSLVRTLALDYAEHAIRVNAIVPGTTETPLMWANVPDDEVEAVRATIRGQVALGRLAQPEEIAAGILWLLGDASSYVTGSHLVVDGGLGATAHVAA
jgi:NAD(P)-dependent dehydrogenase (short-subunit alcohol dehydrogenase family)